MTIRETTMVKILENTGLTVERNRNGTPTIYVFQDSKGCTVGRPCKGIAAAESVAFALHDYARGIRYGTINVNPFSAE